MDVIEVEAWRVIVAIAAAQFAGFLVGVVIGSEREKNRRR